MSDCFSRTIIISVATMLNAATPMTSSSSTNRIDLVVAIERKKLACSRVQSLM